MATIIKEKQIEDLDASKITSGQFADGRISQSSVTQHQGAIDHDALSGFVANEHINHASVSINAGNGLTGGGNLTASRTLNVGAGTGITVAADTVSVNPAGIDHDTLFGVNSDEHINHTSVSINAGNGLTGGGAINITRTLNVGAGTGITVAANTVSVNPAGVNHDALSGFVANEHINHASVSITGVNSITGGGAITASQTVQLFNDTASPGNSFYYGTNSGGTKGWYTLPAGGGFGQGQTWQNVTGSRAFNTNYFNTTGREIMVCIGVGGPHSTTVMSTQVNSFVIMEDQITGSGDAEYCCSFVVPAGVQYRVDFPGGSLGGGFFRWSELR